MEVKYGDQVGKRRAIVSRYLGVECENRDLRYGWGYLWLAEVVVGPFWYWVRGPVWGEIGVVGGPLLVRDSVVGCDRFRWGW